VKATTARLRAYLATKPQSVIPPDCFTLTLADGTVYRYTNADVPVTIYRGEDPNRTDWLSNFSLPDTIGITPAVFVANAIRIQGLKSSLKIGLDVDEQEITIYATASELIQGLPALVAMRAGVFDNATIQRETAFLWAWGLPAIGAVTRFHGFVSTIGKIGYSEAQLRVKSDLVRLDTPYPRNIYQPTCMHVLFDSGCTLIKSAFAVNGTVGSGSTQYAIHWTDAHADGYFEQGTVTFLTGQLAGQNLTVKSSTGSLLTMADAMPAAPHVGDTFHVYPGCDHTPAGGCTKLNNLSHFRGFPRVPPPIMGV